MLHGYKTVLGQSVLLNDTTRQPKWGSNTVSLDLESRPCFGLPFILGDVETDSKAMFMCNICTRVCLCTLDVNLQPGYMLCHENGVLRKYTRVQNYTRVQISPYFPGGANGIEPECIFAPVCILCI